jgi:hypothetical protein
MIPVQLPELLGAHVRRWPMHAIAVRPATPNGNKPQAPILPKDLPPVAFMPNIKFRAAALNGCLIEQRHAHVEWSKTRQHDAQNAVNHHGHKGDGICTTQKRPARSDQALK